MSITETSRVDNGPPTSEERQDGQLGEVAASGDIPFATVVGAAERILGTASSANQGGSTGPQLGNPGLNSNQTPPIPSATETPALIDQQPIADPEANEAVRSALSHPETTFFVFGAYVAPGKHGTIVQNLARPGQRSAPDKSQMAATIVAEGAHLDLQHSSDLSQVGEDGRSRSREPLLLTMRDTDDTPQFFAYDHRTLIRFPEDWVGMLQEDLQATGRSVSPDDHARASLNLDFGVGRSGQRSARVEERASGIVTEEFVRTDTWNYANSTLPSELTVGEVWGGNSGAAGLRLEAVTVGGSALHAAGYPPDDLSAYPNMHFEETMSPLTYAAAMLGRVEAQQHKG
jgi:hypothetical protein